MNIIKISFNKIKILLVVALVLASNLLLVNCTEDSEDFVLGEEYIESQTGITLVDTFDVDISTVILDTMETSNTGTILLGGASDDVFGETHSDSYLEVGPPDSYYIDEEDVYDSLTFVLTYDGYFYGDTTKSQKISVYRLSENIEFDEGKDYFTSNTTFSYDPEPLGSIVYTPEPTDEDSVIIRLDDDLGMELYNMIKEESEYLEDDEVFVKYFYGLALIADDSDEGSIIGFNGSEDDAAIVLHITRPGLEQTKIEYTFGLINESEQFNNIRHDFSPTLLEGLEEQKYDLPSSEANNFAFIQGCTGLTVRVDFPTLENILLRDRGTIMEAELVLAPANTHVYDYDLPSDLTVYEVGALNKVIASGVSSSVLSVDDLDNENTYYSFDITDYIQYEVADNYIDPDIGLLITIPGSDLVSSFDRVIIDAQNKNTQLKIYYMTY